ncbi:MAG: hypothetical protein J7K72_03790 [Candidatus Aenigmarchaeota archaeon]|nr:hypothetical protein [Candidatus Aenigmarchaeota archaeon]
MVILDKVKINITDDCFAPRKTRILDYKGPDPFMWVRGADALLRSVWETSATGIFEPRWMWDWTGDPIQLYYWKMARHSRTTGRWSEIWISIRMVGFKYKSKNEGTFRMEIEPMVKHKFKGNKLEAFLWWIYWHLFYNRYRQELIDRCRKMTERFIAAIKEMYSMGSIEVE